MLLLPFCYVFTILNKTPKKIVLVVILTMTVLSFREIVKASEIATERLAVLEQIAKRAEHPKLIAELKDFNEPSLYYNHWNTVVDSYVIAKCKANKEFTLIVTPDKYTFKFDSTDVHQFLGPPWYPYWNKKFENNTYFKLPRTGYRLYENNEVK
jgi:hypothetical protein